MEIVSTLLNINGTMKEFAEDIESKLGKAYRSSSKKYGMSDSEMAMKRAQS